MTQTVANWLMSGRDKGEDIVFDNLNWDVPADHRFFTAGSKRLTQTVGRLTKSGRRLKQSGIRLTLRIVSSGIYLRAPKTV